MDENLGDSLRAWAHIAKGQGEHPSADLLIKAAEAVSAGKTDDELAIELAAYSVIASKKAQHGFAYILGKAARALGSRATV